MRRINISAAGVINEADAPQRHAQQLDLFTDYETKRDEEELENRERAKERKAREAVIELRKRFGKNAVIKGANLEEGSTAIARNKQIGGHKA